MALCDSCRNFNLHAHSAVLNGRISYQLSKVQTAARAGCPFCVWLVQTVGDSVKQASQRDSKTELWVHLKLLSRGRLVSSTSLEQREASTRGGLQVDAMTIEVAPRYFLSFWNKWPVKAAADICVAADIGMGHPLPPYPISGQHVRVGTRLTVKYRKPGIRKQRRDWAIHWLRRCLGRTPKDYRGVAVKLRTTQPVQEDLLTQANHSRLTESLHPYHREWSCPRKGGWDYRPVRNTQPPVERCDKAL